MILRAASAALYLAVAGPSAVGAAEPVLRGNHPDQRSLSLARNGADGHDDFQKLGANGCTVLQVVGLCAETDDDTEPCRNAPTGRQFACEDLDTGAIYDIENNMEELASTIGQNAAFAFDSEDTKANLLKSAENNFQGDANVDIKNGSIHFVTGKFTKSLNPRQVGLTTGSIFGRPVETRTVIVLNVESIDGNTTAVSNVQLANSVFGSLVGGSDEVNLGSQYPACSHGQLNFVPHPDQNSSAPTLAGDLVDGVVTVYSTVRSDDYTEDPNDDVRRKGRPMVNDAIAKLRAAHGPRGGADHVMVCLPNSAMSGVAWAFVNHFQSMYRNFFCTYSTAQMHEVGHNLGLQHSNEDPDGPNDGEYGDKSGSMTFVNMKAERKEEVRKCFIGPMTWKLGWFDDRHVELEAGVDSFSGRLYGFTRYSATTSADKMIIRVSDPSCSTCDDWYISFNHQADFNQDTEEGKNMVQLHTKEGPVEKSVDTWVQARLAEDGSYTMMVNGTSVEVAVGEINTSEGWAFVQVGTFATGSYYLGCGSTSRGCSGQTQEADVSETHELRCCSTQNLGGRWKQYTSGCWGLSEIEGPGLDGCIHAINFNEGRKKCQDAGGDLCTLAQLQNDCSRGSGCSHDYDFIWSLDKVPEPTSVPTTKPTNLPTSVPTTKPTNLPTHSPTDKPTYEDGYALLACGRNGRCSPPEDIAHMEEEHPVRCCADSDLGVGWKKNNGCSVWAESEVNGNQCSVLRYHEAKDLCARHGARLCWLDEITSNCSMQTGCRYDNRLVWAANTVSLNAPTMVPTYELTGYAWLACARRGYCTTQQEIAPVEEEHSVRCCSDRDPGSNPDTDWIKPQGCSVWIESDDPNTDEQCGRLATWQEAKDLCSSFGARVCTLDEMISSCAAVQGCVLDTKMVWTATPAPVPTNKPTNLPTHSPTNKPTYEDGYAMLACGRNGSCNQPQEIARMEEEHPVRCCADSDLGLGWEKRNGCSVWAESEVGNQCSVLTYHEAKDHCSSYGARLCWLDEITSDCSIMTGCGYDNHLVWTATPVISAYLGCGSRTGCTRLQDISPLSMGEEHPVRCCSDSPIDCTQCTDDASPWMIDNNKQCATSPDLMQDFCKDSAFWTASNFCQQSCFEAGQGYAGDNCCPSQYTPGNGWVKWDSFGCSVWGESEVGGECSVLTWQAAKDLCSSHGARLCTLDEMLAGCTESTGCGFNEEQVWTATPFLTSPR